MLRLKRNWRSEAEYVKEQGALVTPTARSEFGDAPGTHFIELFDDLIARGDFFMNDTVADFGGNDGTAAYQFYLHHKVKPLVVDCVPERIDFAAKVYGLSTYEGRLENMKDLESKSIDWGFCSHTLEHLREPEKGLREIARVIRRGCFFIVPTSDERENAAHTLSSTSTFAWLAFISKNGWNVKMVRNMPGKEVHFFARPK